MKASDVIQQEKAVITLDDVDEDLFEQVLKFIYTDTCDLLKLGTSFPWTKKKMPEEERKDDVASQHSNTDKRKKGKGDRGKDKGHEGDRFSNPVTLLKALARRFELKQLERRSDGISLVEICILHLRQCA